MDERYTDVLRFILTTLFTYREQCYILTVCKQWYKLILHHYGIGATIKTIYEYNDAISDVLSVDNHDAMSWDETAVYMCKLDMSVANLCRYLAAPDCRLLFVEPRARQCRYKLITDMINHYPNTIKNGPAAIAIRDALHKIDTCHILSYIHNMKEYWVLSHEDIIINTAPDISYDQINTLFE